MEHSSSLRSTSRAASCWRRALVAALVFGFALAACGGEDSKDVDFIPTDATYAVVVNIGDGKDSAWNEARDTLRRVPATRLVEDEVLSRDAIAELLLGRKVDYDSDIKPWIGEHGGIAGGFHADNPLDSAVYWFEFTDEDAALAAMGSPTRDFDYRDTTIFEAKRGAFFAVLGDTLVASHSEGYLKKAIRAADGVALEEADTWRNVMKQRSGNDALVSVVMRQQTALGSAKAIRDVIDRNEDVVVPRQQLVDDPLAVHVGIGNTGVWLDAVTGDDHEPGARSVDQSARSLLDTAPAGSVAAVASPHGAVPSRAVAEGIADVAQRGSQASSITLAQRLATLVPAVTEIAEYEKAFTGAIVSSVGYDTRRRLNLTTRRDVADIGAAVMVIERELARLAAATSVDGRSVEGAATGSAGAGPASARGGEIPVTLPPRVVDEILEHASLITTFFPQRLRDSDVPDGLRRKMTYRYQADTDTVTGTLVTGVTVAPRAVIDTIAESSDGTAGLANVEAYTQAMDVSGAPDDADVLGWIDAGRLALTLNSLSKEEAFVVNQQLEHVGGVVFWSTSSDGENKAGAIVRHVVELPLYE